MELHLFVVKNFSARFECLIIELTAKPFFSLFPNPIRDLDSRLQVNLNVSRDNEEPRNVHGVLTLWFFAFLDTDNQRVIIHLNDVEEEAPQEHHAKHSRQKRRVTRAVRPTKRIEFAESDGDTEGRNVFQLEKETERETFKIRDDNPWVTVETNGAVRVKKKWDYEELGPEKTIDFWVIISNQGHNGKERAPRAVEASMGRINLVSRVKAH